MIEDVTSVLSDADAAAADQRLAGAAPSRTWCSVIRGEDTKAGVVESVKLGHRIAAGNRVPAMRARQTIVTAIAVLSPGTGAQRR